eukprot:Opistho-1_new@3043
MASHEDLKRAFVAIGLAEQKAEEAARNDKLAAALKGLIDAVSASGAAIDKSKGILLYGVATRFPGTAKEAAKKALALHVGAGKIKNDLQLTAALDYIKAHPTIEALDADFDKSCGVGVEITPAQVKDAVAALLKSRQAELKEKRYQLAGLLLIGLKNDLKWADGKLVKDELDAQLAALLGPKTADDEAAGKGKGKKDEKKADDKPATPSASKAAGHPFTRRRSRSAVPCCTSTRSARTTRPRATW